MKRLDLSVVIPAYNEEANLPEIHRRIIAAVENCVDSVELIFVDDGSADRTAELGAELHDRDPRVGLIQLSRNFGHQIALMAGLDSARGNAVVAMDADLQHPPELLPELIARWREGVMVVQTVREDAESTGWLKRLTSHVFYRAMQELTDLAIAPGAADFFLLDRAVVDAINQCRESARFTRGLLPWLGFRRELVPYVCGERFSGSSKYSLRKMLRLALDGVFSFSVVPLRLAGTIGLGAVFLGAAYLLYALCVRIFGQSAVPGWTSVVGVSVFLGGIQLIMLWVIGEYIARIADQTRHRPPYLVSSSIDPLTAGAPPEVPRSESTLGCSEATGGGS